MSLSAKKIEWYFENLNMHYVHSSINMMPLTIIKFNTFTFGNAKSFLPSLLYNFNEVQLLPQCISGRKNYSQEGKCLNSNYRTQGLN